MHEKKIGPKSPRKPSVKMNKKKSGRKTYLITALLLISAILCLFLAKSLGWIGSPPAVGVFVSEAKNATIVELVSASGRIQPVEEVGISAEVSGEIRALYVAEGDSVSSGDLLLKIRPDKLLSVVARSKAALNTQKAQLAQSKARKAQAEARYIQSETKHKRSRSLYEEKVLSEQEFEAALTDFRVAKAELEAATQSVEAAKYTVRSAEASLDEAQKNLGLTGIYSPTQGVITKLAVEKGETVLGTQQMQGTKILTIANLNRMEVRVNVSENDIIRIEVGDTARVEVDSYAYMDEHFKGVVTAIAHSANAANSPDAVTEFMVKIRILNNSYQHLISPKKTAPFRPGMTAGVDIITNQKSGILTVPTSAVTTREKKKKEEKKQAGKKQQSSAREKIEEVVFVYAQGKAEMRKVVTGISDFERIEILSGITAGEKVVKGPFLQVSKKLKAGQRIKIMDEKTKKKP